MEISKEDINVDADGYDGAWLDNKKHGYGRQQYPAGSLYEGMFRKGLRHGEGKYTWSDGSYDGGWNRGKKDGYGYYVNEHGVRRKGFWANGQR